VPSLVFVSVFTLLLAGTLGGWLGGFNGAICNWLSGMESPGMTGFMKTITAVGEWYVCTAVTVALIAFPKTRRFGVGMAIVLIITTLLTNLFKVIFTVPRPDINPLVHAGGYGLPSGHASNIAAFMCGMCVIVERFITRKDIRITIFVTAAFIAALVGISRIYLGVHTAADVLAGWALGAAVCCTLYSLTYSYQNK